MPLPQKLGRYTLERRLAAGGMAEVFLARQTGPEGFEKICVVKRMLPHLNEDQTFVAMFLDEARLAARLTHPNIAQIFDFGHDDVEDAYYLSMEYVAGSNLHRVIDDHARRHKEMPVGPVARIIALACAGLDFAHDATDGEGARLHIIHRDVSPHNIMLSKSGDVKLIDFGIAKANVGMHATKAGTLKGKYAYMAPEQVRGQPLDHRTDIYAMGLVLYELLAGRAAITGDSEATLMGAAARRDFPALSTLRPDVPKKVCDIIDRATAMNLAERYQSAAEMGDALDDFLVESGTRVRSSELAALLSASTSVTNVAPGTPSGARVLATPADRTEIAQPSQLASQGRGAPPLEPQEVTAPQAAPVSEDAPVVPAAPPRRFPAVLALLLIVLAAASTLFAYLQTRAQVETGQETALLVPPPPERALVPPRPVEAPKPVAEAAAPKPVEAPSEPPKAEPHEKTPKKTHAAKEPKDAKTEAREKPPAAAAAAPQGKGTVAFRVLPYGEVFQAGTSIGVTPLKPLELEPGKYSFKFVCSDTKKSETRDVTVTPGGQSVVKVDLR